MPNLILLRHGQSQWNLENRFTGETDIDLTPQGEIEAKHAAQLMKNTTIDIAFTSKLIRALHTLKIVLSTLDIEIPIIESATLNERNYGKLQGLNKADVEKEFGHDQLMLWRRSYDASPPDGESLKTTFERVVPYYQKQIEPYLVSGKNVFIVAHGNSLRALMMHLENISPSEIYRTNIATGAPRLYQFTEDLKLTEAHYLI